MQLPQLPRIDGRRRAGHEVDGLCRFGKRDDVADRALRCKDGDNAIEAERDAAVRRRAVLEGIQEESEPQLRVIVRDLEQLEDEPLELLIMDTDAAAGDLAAV